MNNNVRCSFCGIIIEDTFYKCLDNYLQICFFDTEGENCFCSEECFCKYMNLQQEKTEEENKPEVLSSEKWCATNRRSYKRIGRCF